MKTYSPKPLDTSQIALPDSLTALLEKLAENAQHMSDEINYKILMRLGDTIYECRTSAQAATFIDWSPGKQFPVRIDGKTLLAKNPNGQIVQMNIKKTSH